MLLIRVKIRYEAMDDVLKEEEHPKKRRRRHYNRQPLPARLVFDDGLLGDIGVLSENLWTKLEMDVEGMSVTALRKVS